MPRRNRTPILTPIRAYYAFERKRLVQEEKALADRARKRRAQLKNRLEGKAERDAQTEKRMNADIDKMMNRPSKLAVSILQDMVRSTMTPAAIRVRAAAVLTQWATGDFTNDKRRRRSRQET